MTRDEIEDADTAADGRMHRVPAHGRCYILMLRERATPEQRADPTWKPMVWKRPTEVPATFAELKPPGYWDGERFVEVRMAEPGTYEEAKMMSGGPPNWDDEWEDDWDFTADPPTRRTD
jgi:hypothetical protein